MIHYPDISPIIVSFGPLAVRWYGMMYIFGFAAGWFLLRHLVKTKFLNIRLDQVEDLLIAMFIGMLIGARLIFMLVYYEPTPGIDMPWWEPFAVWHGGLSFHGAVLGMICSALIFSSLYKVSVWELTDSLALCGFSGVFFGRIGNFINAELYGRITDVPWAMAFPVRESADGAIIGWTDPRHPSQLYEAFAEGLLCFAIVWTVKPYIKFRGGISAIGLTSYGVLRFICEFFREPDVEIGYIWKYFTMGQVLCAIMIVAGIIMFFVCKKKFSPTINNTAS